MNKMIDKITVFFHKVMILNIIGLIIFTWISIPIFLGTIPLPSFSAITFIILFSIFQYLLMFLINGPTVDGPKTENNHIPKYKNNGLLCFFVTIITYLSLIRYNVISHDFLISIYPSLITTLNILGILVALLLWYKGTYFPNCKDAKRSGNFTIDFYTGIELYPTIFGQHIKIFTNCRFGMTLWGLLVISCLLAKPTLNMFVSSLIMGIYIINFFWWEAGYYSTLDIMHDRCGYYICYGCIAFLPLFYISPLYYQVTHVGMQSPFLLFMTGIFGLIFVYLNYIVDYQKQCFKELRSRVDDSNLLLTDGWWGKARKINYTFEILSTLCWCLPAGFNSPIPYYYLIYIIILLIHRTYRDEIRCSHKYGKQWLSYKRQVPYLYIPGLI